MASPSVKLVELWDPVVRLTHWSIAVIVLLNAVLTEGDSLLHIWAGWVGMAILAMRLLWGLIGTPEARFVAFPPNPRAALSHLANLVAGRPDHYPSHNPAGAAMAYALWGTLGLLMFTGLVMTGGDTPMQIADQRAAVAAGDWSVLVPAGDSSDNGGDNGGGETGDSKAGTWAETAKEVHGLAGNLIIFLALMHVAGVVFESRAMRRNLVKPMLFGQDK